MTWIYFGCLLYFIVALFYVSSPYKMQLKILEKSLILTLEIGSDPEKQREQNKIMNHSSSLAVLYAHSDGWIFGLSHALPSPHLKKHSQKHHDVRT